MSEPIYGYSGQPPGSYVVDLSDNNAPNVIPDFKSFFDSVVEYPKDVAYNPLPIGTHYTRVSDSILNGFINYVDIKRAWCLNRYLSLDAEYDNNLKLCHPKNSIKWLPVVDIIGHKPTKREVLALLNEKGRTFHSKLDCDFQDDVLILSKAKNDDDSDTVWVYFWYDRDCSDCCIGRFVTTLHDQLVLDSFDTYAANINTRINTFDTIEPPTLIELHYFTGWLGSR